ncbi:DUF3221 domain-containing protein [Sporosarcina aquimarina]|nr:DUF3221 domain-containing protein [Sporosarcina aquimarina]MBY0224055.1 DUF3221 domain-containing protein [Sporosarcina aquimarina]
MNEVKRSLDRIVGDVTTDKEELKQRVLSGKRKSKRKNPFPLVATVIVMTAVLFFTFNVFQGEYLKKDGSEYEVNEELYDLLLKSEQHEIEDPDELRTVVMQRLVESDSLIEYAKSLGYLADEQAMKEELAKEQQTFFEGFNEEELNSVEQTQLENFGYTYEQYFQTIHKHTIQFTAAVEWLDHNPPAEHTTQREVLDAFLETHADVITEFMEKKQIPPADPSSVYVEFEGLVAAIENRRVLVVQGVEKDQIEGMSAEEIQDAAYDSAWFEFDETIEQLALYRQINVTFDPLSYPVSQAEQEKVFEDVSGWE